MKATSKKYAGRTVYLVDPERIDTPHEPRDVDHLLMLIDKMGTGWKGRPILGERLPAGFPFVAQGWTGTHRIIAARTLSLPVPVVFIDAAALARADWSRDVETGSFWDDAPDSDDERLRAFKALGDPVALRLMRAENKYDP